MNLLIKKRGVLVSGRGSVLLVAILAMLPALSVEAALADDSTTPNLYNATLPLSEITEKTVEHVMCPPPQAVTDASGAASCSNSLELDAATSDATVNSDAAASKDLSSQPASKSAKAELDPSNNNQSRSGEAPTNAGGFANQISLGLPAGSILGKVEKDARATGAGPIVVDNDQENETKETIKYRELPTNEGGTKVLIGATFPVVLCSQITSKTAKIGDPIEAHLKYDLKVGDRLVATKGSLVRGHLDYVLKARCAMHSLISPTRWYRNSGCVGVSFDELINEKGEHIPLVAKPAQSARIVKNKYEGRVLGVNHNGQITGPWAQQLRYKAIRIGLNAAMAPAGVFSFGAMPVALGVIGAINPSFAFMKPVGQNVRHRRIKGFIWGALSGVPGSWLIEDTVVKGQEAVIMPGDELLAEFKQEFTGEPVTDASLMDGADTKVHGQVLPRSDRK